MTKLALRGLLTRKLRSVLTGFAVVIGVAFVVGTLVFTDTINESFKNLFERVQRAWTSRWRPTRPSRSLRRRPRPASTLDRSRPRRAWTSPRLRQLRRHAARRQGRAIKPTGRRRSVSTDRQALGRWTTCRAVRRRRRRASIDRGVEEVPLRGRQRSPCRDAPASSTRSPASPRWAAATAWAARAWWS